MHNIITAAGIISAIFTFLRRYRAGLFTRLKLGNNREEVRDEARDRWMAESRATFSNSPADSPSALAKRGKMVAKAQESTTDFSSSSPQVFLDAGSVDVRTPCENSEKRTRSFPEYNSDLSSRLAMEAKKALMTSAWRESIFSHADVH